jgi:signal transduction histidine kinase
VLSGGLALDTIIEQKLSTDVQASDQALAQEIALQTSLQLSGEKNALVSLGKLVAKADTPTTLTKIFQTFQTARSDVDQVYWLNELGVLRLAWPQDKVVIGAEFSPPGVVQRALTSSEPVLEVGIATETSVRSAGVIIAEPVRNASGKLIGIVAVSFSLVELSLPLRTVIQAQQQLGRHLNISVIDESGKLIATPEQQRILQTVQDELPGSVAALDGQTISQLSKGSDGQEWLFSAVPVQTVSWAVVVQRPTNEALAIVTELRLWLLFAVLLFTLGGLLFWLLLLRKVIRPLHILASQYQSLPTSPQLIPVTTTVLSKREDEMGDLARSLIRLERDGLKKLTELETLLETSNAVVKSLEPHTVVRKIIREVRKIVDVQAASVLLPDEQGVLHVLVSDGHSDHYNRELSLSPTRVNSTAVVALRNGKPVQKLLESGQASLSYEEGFRSVLAIPIISRHAGEVVLLVHRTEPQPFEQNEINLLLTFANYATLAWEHAVLYERSDERLREVAHENARLYKQASEEQQKLEAIMGSMRDGLVLTGTDGIVLYANLGVSTLAGLSNLELENHSISLLYMSLRRAALDNVNRERVEILAATKEATELIVETKQNQQYLVIQLWLFDVSDKTGRVFGRGLLLRDVTREYELNEFKTTLIAAVGHELRTPLTAIKGYASTLLQEDVAWPLLDQRHFLQMISAESDRLAQLVSNLLDLSRQEAGLLLLNQTSTDIQALIIKTLEQTKHTAAQVTLHIPDDLPPVNVDKARIEVVIHNLIINALTYGEGEVHIAAEKRDDAIVVTISDNGPGIALEELPHVFERFYRAGWGRQQRAGGTGLGLNICKAFIEAHQSKIWAESSTHGTKISFSLPLFDISSAQKDMLKTTENILASTKVE